MTAGMVIVGAGECGVRAALTLREEGYGGAVTLIGAETHLPYERPPLSKEAMSGDDLPLPRTIAGEGRLAEADIKHLGSVRVTGIDRAARSLALDTGGTIGFDKLLLATGAEPRRLALAQDSRRCLYLRTFDDALAIRSHLRARSRVAIIGGGFIGLELAAAAGKSGCVVTVIEAQPRILMRGVPAEIARMIHDRHVAEGVTIVCGQAVGSIADTSAGVTTTLAGGATVEADIAIIGIGSVPNTALAEAAGLTIDNGIAVDERLCTNDPDILAAGDCCSFPLAIHDGRRVRLEAWRNALEQGTLAARNMLGARTGHAAVPWFWSDQYDLGLQIAGLADGATETVRRDAGDGALILFHLAGDGRLVAASGIGPGTAIARDIRLAEMLIAKRAYPSREKLGQPGTKLKTLLAA